MNRIFLLMTITSLGASGCMTLTPVGPITTKMFPPLPSPQSASMDAASKPMLPPGPPPAAPTFLIGPGEVGTSDGHDAARRLARELEADRNALEAMPNYAEVSTVGAK